MKDERITVCINTKDRVEYLLVTLSSLLGQTYQEWDLIVMDASSEPSINREQVERLFRIMKRYGHKVRYETDQSIGIPWSYQKMLDMAETDLLIRQEDDIWMEPEMIQNAYEALQASDKIGAVGFMTPNYQCSAVVEAPEQLANGFRKVESSPLCPNRPFIWEATDQQEIVVYRDVVWDVCVIHAGSLYRRKAAESVGGFCTHLSPVGHREESLFYVRMYMTGWNLAVRSRSRLWHFESAFGGSRPEGAHADARQNMRRSDESKFQAELAELIEGHPDRPLLLFDPVNA